MPGATPVPKTGTIAAPKRGNKNKNTLLGPIGSSRSGPTADHEINHLSGYLRPVPGRSRSGYHNSIKKITSLNIVEINSVSSILSSILTSPVRAGQVRNSGRL